MKEVFQREYGDETRFVFVDVESGVAKAEFWEVRWTRRNIGVKGIILRGRELSWYSYSEPFRSDWRGGTKKLTEEEVGAWKEGIMAIGKAKYCGEAEELLFNLIKEVKG